MTAEDLAGLSTEKLQFVVDHGDPAGQLYPLAQQVLKSRAAPVKPSVAMPLRPEQQAHIQRELETTARPLPLPHHGVAQGVADAAAGLAGGVYSGVPGLAPALEAGGELSDTLVPGQDPRFNLLPRPGQIRQAMEESPQGPIVSSTLGAAAPLVGQAGLLGKGAQAASQAAMAPATSIYQNLAGKAPGLVRTLAAGAGTGTAIGAGEAAIRRLPAVEQGLGQAMHGQPVTAEVPPLQFGSEIASPALGGLISSLLPAMSSWASNPNTIMGKRAQTFARDKASGAHQQEPLASRMEGQAGIDQAKEIADRQYEDQMPALEAPVRALERQNIAGMKRETDATLGDYQMRRGDAADETSKAITKKLEDKRAATRATRESEMQDLDQRTAGKLLDTSGFFKKAQKLVNGYSSEGASKPDVQVLLPNGRALARAAFELKDFLPESGATMRDFRNAIKYAKSKAQSGTDEQRWPYETLLGELKTHAKNVDPTREDDGPGLYAQSNQRFRDATTEQERTKQIVFGGPDESKVELSPQTEARGRQGLIQLGDTSTSAAAKIPHREELIKYGYEPEIKAMEQRLADVEQMSYETQRAHDEAVAKVKAETEAQLRDISRDIRPQTDAVLESKVAQEASKFRLSGLTKPLTMAAIAVTTHSPAHAALLGTYAGEHIGSRLSQPIASTIAANTPDAAAMRSSIPGMMGVATSGPEAAKSMVEQARKQKDRLKTSILDCLQYNRPKAKQENP